MATRYCANWTYIKWHHFCFQYKHLVTKRVEFHTNCTRNRFSNVSLCILRKILIFLSQTDTGIFVCARECACVHLSIERIHIYRSTHGNALEKSRRRWVRFTSIYLRLTHLLFHLQWPIIIIIFIAFLLCWNDCIQNTYSEVDILSIKISK